jgi:alpha-mannosidase
MLDSPAPQESAKKNAATNAREIVQCHFISNTHWDREWRYSAQRTRYAVVELLDMLFDIIEKEPEYRTFHLDSQTLPLQDYLEIRPEMEETVRRHVQSKKLVVGPWFCLPDEFCVAGESLIRNLLLGHRIARRYGEPSKTGYSPFGWGQISQLPQIYKGFGIHVASFYRGVNAEVSRRSEFYWEAPDGTRIVASRLSRRPRYNVWYIIHRRVFQALEDCNHRVFPWRLGGAPFGLIDRQFATLDMQYAHPIYRYEEKRLEDAVRQALHEQDGDWTTPHRFWSEGHDSSAPDHREVRMIEDADRILGDKARVFHSTVAEWEQGILAHENPDWPVARGEMRRTADETSSSGLMGDISSARMYIKQENFAAERDLMLYAEPLSVFASLLGAPYPRGFLDVAANWLLQNHGHDSIGACSRDVVHDDMMFRFRQAREIAACLIEKAMQRIAGAVDVSGLGEDDVAIVVFNPTPHPRTEVAEIVLNVPAEVKFDRLKLVASLADESGRALETEILDARKKSHIIQSPNDCANVVPATQVRMLARFEDLPPMGWRAFRLVPIERRRWADNPRSMRRGLRGMENEFLKVEIQDNGALSVAHKETGRVYRNQGVFLDEGERGNPWQHFAPVHDRAYTTANERPEIALVRDNGLETAYEARFDWRLPESRDDARQSRSRRMRNLPITNTITLRKGQPWVEISTEIDNQIEDHMLRALFPSGVQTDTVHAQGQFDVVERNIPIPDMSRYVEPYHPVFPMNSFVDISDGERGLAVINEGLKAYEAMDDADRTIAVTLLRCFPLQICGIEMEDYSETDKGSQCLGRHVFRYSIMPHAGDWEKGGVWPASEKHNGHLRIAQIGTHPHGHLPSSGSFLEVDPRLHVSAVKRSESGAGWIVRLFNPSDDLIRTTLRLNGGLREPERTLSPVEATQVEQKLPGASDQRWAAARIVSLEEVPCQNLELSEDGAVELEITGKKIVTVEFLSRV